MSGKVDRMSDWASIGAAALVKGAVEAERTREGNTRNRFAWPSDTDADSVAQKVEQRRVDTEAEVDRLTRQLAGAVVALRAARSRLVDSGRPNGDGARPAVEIIDRALGEGPRNWRQS